MKKIAADENYRILKRASETDEAYKKTRTDLARIMANHTHPSLPSTAAEDIFQAILDIRNLFPQIGKNCGIGITESLIYHPECERSLGIVLGLTEDALEGGSSLWDGKRKILWSQIKMNSDDENAYLISSYIEKKRFKKI